MDRVIFQSIGKDDVSQRKREGLRVLGSSDHDHAVVVRRKHATEG
jgi:hypothetical protein